MELDLKRVTELFALFSELEGEAIQVWVPLCENAGHSISCRLRGEVEDEKAMERLCTAAAVCAYCDWLLLQPRSAARGEIRVGEISVKDTGDQAGLEAARTIRETFMEQVADLIRPAVPLLAVGEKE